jgi:energy-coupling factor transporter ATP-binding protein EcfA2
MQIRRLAISRFRGIEETVLHPGQRTVLLGPNNAAKSTILEALDLALHTGLGRPRLGPDELDYYGRDPSKGFEVEVVLGALEPEFLAEVRNHLEGWDATQREIVPEPDANGAESVVRIRVVGTADLDVTHEFAKPESNGARFGPRLRRQIGWMFDGRARDPAWQMTFHRGGALDRLFQDQDLGPALGHVRAALREGATAFGGDAAVLAALVAIGKDLEGLHLLEPGSVPAFELGGVSERELLQTLRLALPILPDVLIPLRRQGRGVQRLALVASLLRLAKNPGSPPPIGAFEEPEEALEPLRQTQMASLITQIADGGGQVLVVTHSTEIARAFAVEDLHLVSDAPRGDTLSLRDKLSERAKQGYERRLDASVVVALFARVPVLVEGPSDRACLGVFWDALASKGHVKPRFARALDFINCESAQNQPEMARLLCEAGKSVVTWAELDRPDILERLREGGQCAALVLYDADPTRNNLEGALSQSCSISGLARGMAAIADGRGYSWDDQRTDLVSRAGEATEDQRKAMKAASTVEEVLRALPEPVARQLACAALSAKEAKPFEMKGARPARLLAEEILEVDGGVPKPFAAVMVTLDEWLEQGRPAGDNQFSMPT